MPLPFFIEKFHVIQFTVLTAIEIAKFSQRHPTRMIKPEHLCRSGLPLSMDELAEMLEKVRRRWPLMQQLSIGFRKTSMDSHKDATACSFLLGFHSKIKHLPPKRVL